jgi:hypothetical protein
LFSRVPGSRFRAGLRVGLVVAAATAGVLVGLGLRHGTALTPFQLYGRALLASWTGAIAPAWVSVVVGLVAHGFWMLLWGVCFTAVAAPLRARPAALAAVLVGVIAILAAWLFPSALGAVALASLSSPQTFLFVLLLTLSLLAGTRFARA